MVGGTVVPVALSDSDIQILDLARGWWRYAGARETAIREATGLSLPRYVAALYDLIEQPEALAHDPQLVNRLRRRRDAYAARSARRLGFDLAE